MRWTRRAGFALSLALVGAAGGANMADWEQSPAWRQYQDLYARLEDSPDEAAFRRAAEERDNWPGPGAALPPGLAHDLGVLLDDTVQARWSSFRTHIGKPMRPDYAAQLKDSLRHLEHKLRAVRGLRAAGARDPWVEQRLVPDARRNAYVAEQRLEMTPRTRTNAKLESGARALLAEVTREVGPPTLGPARPIPGWQSSAAWKEYQELYRLFGEATARPVGQDLDVRARRLDGPLHAIFAEPSEFPAELGILLSIRGTFPPPGAADPGSVLKRRLPFLRQQYKALRAAGPLVTQDRWLAEVLVPEVRDHAVALDKALSSPQMKRAKGETALRVKDAQELLEDLGPLLAKATTPR